jgi:hypothetical protein
MKSLAKVAFGTLILAGAAFATAQPANAATGFGFSYGYGGYGGPQFSVQYDPCYRPYYARPRFCNYPLYNGRVFFGGAWHHGPFYYRDFRGGREYWHQGRWHRGSLRAGPGFRRNFARGPRGHHGYYNRGGPRRGFGRGWRRGRH